MLITDQLLKAVMPNAKDELCKRYAKPLDEACLEFGINTPARVRAFLAQIAHESGSLSYVRELGSNEYLDKYDQGQLALRLGNTPEDDDDGQKYRGRGFIQITGARNYKACGAALGLPLLEQPELLEQPGPAARSAAWFWYTNGLNELADKGDFERITKRINGGLNGYEDRLAFYARAQLAMGA